MGKLLLVVDEARRALEGVRGGQSCALPALCRWIQARWVLTRGILPAGRRWDWGPGLNPTLALA